MQINNEIAQRLLGKQSFKETSIADWQRIAQDYPAFSLAHLFLAKKLKQENNENYLLQLPKTALYFNDVFWLNFLLNEDEEGGEGEEVREDEEGDEEIEVREGEGVIEDCLAENRLASILQAQAADFDKPVFESEQLQIETEPLYKTDYFASQGIIFKNPQDAFGNKVKKFTDWLKDIKRNNAGAPQLNTTDEEEKEAANQAQASLKAEEIITEPMAEILIAQGKKQQATEIYQKLSLLNPQKTAYFAAKINSLQ